MFPLKNALKFFNLLFAFGSELLLGFDRFRNGFSFSFVALFSFLELLVHFLIKICQSMLELFVAEKF